jgi:hypothetical protein
MYPLPRPAADKRFTYGLAMDVAAVLEQAGYPPVRTGSDLTRLQEHLFAFLYGSGMGVVRDGGTPDRDGAGTAVPARPVATPPSADRPGTPHGRSCIGTCCLPDLFAMGSADYSSTKRVMWL